MKKWVEPFSTAWVGVITHKMRSFLTILGIVIGVGAVISLMSIGRGAEQDIISRIETLGSNLVFVRPGSTSVQGVRGGNAETLTINDAWAIAEQVPYIDSIAPSYSRTLDLNATGQNMSARVTGITPEYMQAYNLEIADGSFISEYDFERGAKVAVIGSNIKEPLFEGLDPIGQVVRMENNIVHIVGVLVTKGAMARSSDDAILVPMTTLQRMANQPRTSRGEPRANEIAMTISEEGQSSLVVEQMTEVLRTRHQLGPGIDDDFRITSMEEIASTMSETIGTMTLLLGAIAAISLLVGGIGVMNIMLVSVLERTREIGIRKALGARDRDIWSQFLIEAAFLSFTGGIIGIILGWVISLVVNNTGTMTTVVTADIVILAASVSVGIGLFFGFYPAWNASRLNPIDALRTE
ncbi:ABC transporter permease [Chloroflexota bacterium]